MKPVTWDHTCKLEWSNPIYLFVIFQTWLSSVHTCVLVFPFISNNKIPLSNSRLGWGRKISAMKKVANIDKVTNSNVLWCQDNKMYHVWSVVTQNYASVFLRYMFAKIDQVTHSSFNYVLTWFQTNYTSQQWFTR